MIVSVGTSKTSIVPIKRNRAKIFLQNNGKHPIYLKKVNPGDVNPTVSTTNFDFMLDTKGAETPYIIEIESISGFIAIASPQASDLSVMETFYVQ